MKGSTIGAAGLLFAASAAGVGAAVDLTGNGLTLSGSDSLKFVVQQVLANTPSAHPNIPGGTSYIGGGQSVGDSAIDANTQQISVGTASIKASVYTGSTVGSLLNIDADGNSATGTGGKEFPITHTTEALLLGLDGLSVLANNTATGAPAAPAGFGLGLAVAGKSFVVHDHSAALDESGPIAPLNDATHPNGFYGTAAEEAAGTSVYTIQSSLDVLRLIYGGLHHDIQRNATNTTLFPAGSSPVGGTFNAASDVRRSLANQWESIFNTGSALSGKGLNHAYRRSDLAGTTNAFVALVGFGGRKIGQLTGTGSNKTTSPFVNDAAAANLTTSNNTGVIALAGARNDLNSAVTNNAGSGDQLDLDPIRRPAQLSGRNSIDQVASPGGTLGLVLPIFFPDPSSFLADVTSVNSPAYPLVLCDAGAFALVATGPSGFDAAPEGPTFLSQSFQPYYIGTATKPPADGAKHFNCLSKQNSKSFGAFATDDGRQFNLPVRDDATGAYLKDLNNRELAAAFYRIRSAGLPSPSTAPTLPGLVRETTSDFQIGHTLVLDDHSIGYAGRGVDLNPTFGSSIAGLWLSGSQSPVIPASVTQFDSTLSTPPTDQNILNLLINPAGTVVAGTVLDTAAHAAVYPLARRTYLTTLVGFSENPKWSVAQGGSGTFDPTAHAVVNGVDQGASTAVRGLQGQEYELAKAFGDSDHLAAALVNNGFVPLPTAAQYVNPAVPPPTVNYTDASGATHYGASGWSGAYALDYPEYDSANPNAKFLATGPGATAGGANADATALSPPVLVSYGVSTAAAQSAAATFADAHFAAAGFADQASAEAEARAYYAPNLTVAGVAYPVHTPWPAGPDPVWASLPGGTLDTQVTDSNSTVHDYFHGFYF
jgi:hypothetical protein